MMKPGKLAVMGVACFLLGAGLSWVAAKKSADPAAHFSGKEPDAAAASLLQLAERLAGKGSWELIAVGRVHYLSGDKAKGQQYFDRVTSRKPEKSDWYRIGRVYVEAGEWDKAEPILKRVVAADPDDSSGLAEVGAYYNLRGDRETAEELFARSLRADDEDFWAAVGMAGSYVGVTWR